MSSSDSEGNSDSHKGHKGVVKWFNDAKGFGFIEHGNGEDVFVHYSVIEVEGFKTLKDGEEVIYELEKGPKGLHAVKVQKKTAITRSTEDQPLSPNKSAESGSSGSDAVAQSDTGISS